MFSFVLYFSSIVANYKYKHYHEQQFEACIDRVCVDSGKVIECIPLKGVYLSQVFTQRNVLPGNPDLIIVRIKKRCR